MGPCGELSPANIAALTELPCLKFVASKTLGYAIVVGSAGVKLPQVYNIVKAGGVQGLSPASILLEMTSLVSTFAYYMALDYPFSTWGENFFLFIQHSLITLAYFHYTGGVLSARSLATVLPMAALGITLYLRAIPELALPAALCKLLGREAESGSCPVTCEQLAGGLPIALMLVGRLPQIIANQRQGHTGTLSLITYALNVLGTAARAFTVMQVRRVARLLFFIVLPSLNHHTPRAFRRRSSTTSWCSPRRSRASCRTASSLRRSCSSGAARPARPAACRRRRAPRAARPSRRRSTKQRRRENWSGVRARAKNRPPCRAPRRR